MQEIDIAKLRELTLLVDLAYLYHFKSAGEGANYKAAEATVRLEFGNLWYRKKHPTEPPAGPEIETVVVYSSVFSAGRVNYFDSLDEAVEIAQGWYEHAKGVNAA